MTIIVACVALLSSPAPASDGGCSFSGSVSSSMNVGSVIDPGMMDPVFAATFEADVTSIRALFGVNAPVVVTTSSSSLGSNALATPTTVSVSESSDGLSLLNDDQGLFAFPGVIKGLDGFVVFSLPLMNELRAKSESYGIPFVVAHEMGHILQYQKGFPSDAPTWKKELDADFLAGYALEIRGHFRYQVDQDIVSSVFQHGDYDFCRASIMELRTSVFKRFCTAQWRASNRLLMLMTMELRMSTALVEPV